MFTNLWNKTRYPSPFVKNMLKTDSSKCSKLEKGDEGNSKKTYKVLASSGLEYDAAHLVLVPFMGLPVKANRYF